MLSITADHALRAVLLLARIPADHAMRADAIAESIGAPRNYLAKTLNALAKAGIVRSSRGPFGGFSLAMSPRELTIARVTQLFDERPRTGACLLKKSRCDADNPCSAHNTWTAITASALHAIEHDDDLRIARRRLGPVVATVAGRMRVRGFARAARRQVDDRGASRLLSQRVGGR